MTEVAIIGAGIGGLTAALALHKHGIGVTVFEQAHQLEEAGAGIQLACNPNHVLRELGLLDATAAVAFEPDTLDLVDGHSGRTLLSASLNGWARDRYGAPYLNIHRGDLQRVLLDALQERVPGALQLNRRVVGLSQDTRSVSVTFSDGQEVNADVAVGADGVHSVLRESVTSVEPARFTRHVAYRMLVPRSVIPRGKAPSSAISLRLGRHGHVVGYWVKGGDVYNMVAVTQDDRWHEENWRTPAELDEVRTAFRSWDGQLRMLIDSSRDVYKWALLDHSVPTTWTRGRAALLGDSCHAMLPFLAQGGAMAIEDAWVLAANLAATTDHTEALRRYSQIRSSRVSRVHATATRNARTFHLTGPARTMRNVQLRLMGKRAERFMAGMDWLYGHNVTAPLTV
jgi:salicylate hydroxylase